MSPFIGTYVGASGSPRLGVYDLASGPGDPARFADILAVLRTAQVYERDPQDKRPQKGHEIVMLDGHHFTLRLYRCSTWLDIEVPNTEFFAETRVETRWETLQPALEKIIDAFAWKQRLPPDQHRDVRAIFTMGASLTGT